MPWVLFKRRPSPSVILASDVALCALCDNAHSKPTHETRLPCSSSVFLTSNFAWPIRNRLRYPPQEELPPMASVMHSLIRHSAHSTCEMRDLEGAQREMSMPPIVRAVLTESADLLVRTVKVTIGLVLLTLAIILVGWFFSSSLPHQALLMINRK